MKYRSSEEERYLRRRRRIEKALVELRLLREAVDFALADAERIDPANVRRARAAVTLRLPRFERGSKENP